MVASTNKETNILYHPEAIFQYSLGFIMPKSAATFNPEAIFQYSLGLFMLSAENSSAELSVQS